jgi:CheY-like chemotaxis protein/two-component sensor histidine kinase
LSAISAAVGVLDQLQGPAPETKRWRNIIRRQTEHLSRLIDDLLDIARVSAGKMSIERTPVELGEIVERCVRELTSGRVSDPRVELHIAETWISADVDRLEQIVTNLLSNAFKHTQANGSIRVTVSTRGDDGVLCVEDTGSGIGAELLPRVFDPFVQGEQGLERAAGGLGIGLALVKRFAELHGGRVEASSPGVGRGSTFTVRLPRIERPALARTEGVEPRLPANRPRRVLLIEDNDDTRVALRELLQLCGYDAHEALDGEAGLAAALRLRPDIVLLDIGLPKLDGYGVARRLKAAVPDVRLVALTGYGHEEDKLKIRLAGFDAHLLKPVGVERVREVIEELLDRPREEPVATAAS